MHALTKTCQQCSKPMNGGLYRASHICPYCLYEHAGGRKSKKQHSANTQIHNTLTPTALAVEVDQQAPKTALKSDVQPEQSANKAQANSAKIANASNSAGIQATIKTKENNKTKSPNLSTKTLAKPLGETQSKTQSKKGANVKVALTTEPSHDQLVIKLFDEINATSILHIELTPDLFINGKFAGTKSPKIQSALKQGKKDVLGQIQKTAIDLGANTVADIEVKNAMKMVDKNSAKITVSASGTALLTETAEVSESA